MPGLEITWLTSNFEAGQGISKIHSRHCKSCVSEGLRKNVVEKLLDHFYPANAAVKTFAFLLYHHAFPSVKVRKVLWSIGSFMFCYAVLMAHL